MLGHTILSFLICGLALAFIGGIVQVISIFWLKNRKEDFTSLFVFGLLVALTSIPVAGYVLSFLASCYLIYREHPTYKLAGAAYLLALLTTSFILYVGKHVVFIAHIGW